MRFQDKCMWAYVPLNTACIFYTAKIPQSIIQWVQWLGNNAFTFPSPGFLDFSSDLISHPGAYQSYNHIKCLIRYHNRNQFMPYNHMKNLHNRSGPTQELKVDFPSFLNFQSLLGWYALLGFIRLVPRIVVGMDLLPHDKITMQSHRGNWLLL